MIGELTKEEVNRKLLHILVVILPVGIFYCPLFFDISRNYMFWGTFALLIISLLVEFLRLKTSFFSKWFRIFFSQMLRVEEKERLTGATYVFGGSALCSLISIHSEIAAVAAFISFTLFILGDAAAAIVGKAIGRMKIGKKTLEGAIGCFILCVILSSSFFSFLPCLIDIWGGQLSSFQIILIPSLITSLEFFPIKLGRFVLNDNLYVAPLTSIIIIIIH